MEIGPKVVRLETRVAQRGILESWEHKISSRHNPENCDSKSNRPLIPPARSVSEEQRFQ